MGLSGLAQSSWKALREVKEVMMGGYVRTKYVVENFRGFMKRLKRNKGERKKSCGFINNAMQSRFKI